MVEFSPSVQKWLDRGRFVEIANSSVFVLETGEIDLDEPVLVLHGFPTSSHDWHLVFPRIEERYRLITLDMPGYGFSDKPPQYSYSLHEQADVVETVLDRLEVEQCHILAHDMGTSVACELLARRERDLLDVDVKSLILMNGSVHIELADLTPSQILLRSPLAGIFTNVASRFIFKWQLKRILGKPVGDEELNSMWDLMLYKDGVERMPKIISYLDERRRFWHRWIGALKNLDIPTLVAWGPKDTVAVKQIAEQLHAEIPNAELEFLDDLGHYPQLENPHLTTETITEFWDKQI